MKTVLLSAVSLDGKIARDSFDKLGWVSRENKKFFAKVTRKAGVVIVGHNTFKLIGKPLEDRLLVVLASKPWAEETKPGKVEFTNDSPTKLLKGLKKRGFKEVFIGGGRKINTLFLKQNLLDEIWLVYEPLILGKGIGLFEEGISSSRFKLKEGKKLSSGLLLLKYERR